MKYRQIKGIKQPVSELVFGCAVDLMQSGGDNSKLLDTAFENGINFFDNARVYGESEKSLGNWMKERGNRKDVIVLTKGCHPEAPDMSVNRVNPEAITKDLDISLSKLQTDYIDLYLLHRDDTSVPVEEIIEALESKKAQGKILQYGVSNWTLERFKAANDYAHSKGYDGFVVNSPNYSLAEQVDDPWQSGSEAISIGGPLGECSRKYYLENNIPIISYSPLARGLFSGKISYAEINGPDDAKKAMDIYAMRGFYSKANVEKLKRVEELAIEKGATVSQIALAYLLNQQLDVFPIVGLSKEKHLKDNLLAVDIVLSKDELEYLEQ